MKKKKKTLIRWGKEQLDLSNKILIVYAQHLSEFFTNTLIKNYQKSHQGKKISYKLFLYYTYLLLALSNIA